MDANGTRFHMLLGEEDWGDCFEVPTDPADDAAGAFPDGISAAGVPSMSLSAAWHASPALSPPPDLEWDGVRLELTLSRRLTPFQAAAKDRPPTLADRRGAARDRYGNWYWIAEDDQEIRVRSAGTGATTHFWSVGDGGDCDRGERPGGFHAVAPRAAPAPLSFSGLAVTDDHYLVVGLLRPKGILVFDLYAGGSPQEVLWPAGVPFVPFDMAAAPGGGVFILDRVNARYWALDRHLQVIRTDQAESTLSADRARTFQPVSGGRPRQLWARTFPLGITLAASTPVANDDPVAIEALPDGTVLILARPDGASFSFIDRYRLGRQVGSSVSTQEMQEKIELASRPQFTLIGHDFAFVAEHETDEGTVPDCLFVADSRGNQAYAFALSQRENEQLVLSSLLDYLPMRLFGGKGLVAAGCEAYYDFGDGWIPLVEQRRPRYSEQATLETPFDPTAPSSPADPEHPRRPAFDGREPNCVWHRLLLDACLPPETTVTVWSRAANDQRDFNVSPWRKEPGLRLRGDGSELPFVRRPPAVAGRGTWELLLQAARGRYLQLKLQLTGNGRVTPRIRALRVYYPRFSYLEQYLPAVFRDDESSASFLDRFLANLEGFETALEDKIAAVQMLFDVRSAPPETLAWLAGWFGAALDPAWDETKQRLFIGHAMEFFRCRGTVRGLQMALRLVHDKCPDESIFDDPFGRRGRPHPIRIVESFRTRRTPRVALGDPTEPPRPRPSSSGTRWLPLDGGAALSRRYRDFISPLQKDPRQVPVRFPLTAPADRPGDWRQFALRVLGFAPSATDGDLPSWREFLARRYHRIRALNEAYGTNWSTFEEVPLPAGLPADGAPLYDWYQFEALVLAMRRAAHRFTVLLPAPPNDSPDQSEHRHRLELTRRVVDLEKPAHTQFDVKFYWAFFRVGEVRLGEDTVLDLGSRDPRLLPPLVLGQGPLAASFLAPGYPQDVSDRQVVGRDAPNH